MTPESRTRDEHLAWCKQRALRLMEKGDLPEAFASMVRDLNKHPETKGHRGIHLGEGLLWEGHLSRAEMRKFIEGFN
mgnify:CR=1 FL=1